MLNKMTLFEDLLYFKKKKKYYKYVQRFKEKWTQKEEKWQLLQKKQMKILELRTTIPESKNSLMGAD